MRKPLVILPAAIALFAQAPQTPAPVYAREGMAPVNGNRAKLLAPGMIVELYGQHLAPEPWCGEKAAPPAPYPTEICGVRVTVGASPAGLMYVGSAQINFKIPASAPAEGSAPIRVCVRGVCGAPVEMRFSAHKAYLKLHGTAAVHMPVWVDIEAPAPYEARYPCGNSPWDFGGFQFEVRSAGAALVPAPKGGASECRADALPGPLPLHLLYRFDQPGIYEVRVSAPAFQSDWTEISVAPETADARDEWLRSVSEQALPASQEALMTDLIPSLLAWPDEKALAALEPLLDRPGPAGQFARAGLAAFPEDLLRRTISPDRLLDYCSQVGTCGHK